MTTAERDCRIITLQSELLDHTGHVAAGVSQSRAQRLAGAINALRAANGWAPLNMRGRYSPHPHPERTELVKEG